MSQNTKNDVGTSEASNTDPERKDETKRSDRFLGAAVGAALISLALVGSAKAGGGSGVTLI